MPRAQARDIEADQGNTLRVGTVAAKLPGDAEPDLESFIAAQNAAFEDGRAYIEARRQRPRR